MAGGTFATASGWPPPSSPAAWAARRESTWAGSWPAGSNADRGRGASKGLDVHRDVAHPQARGKEGILHGVRDTMALADAQVPGDADLDVHQVAEPALSDAARVKARDAGDARRQRPHRVLHLRGHRDVHHLVQRPPEDVC